jgi:succinoglycan biosynthesis protein ExoW
MAVVIPFYQREPGHLARALQSVFQQNTASLNRVTVHLVDDGSPISWRDEVTMPTPPGFVLQVIEQANGGVSAARNAALRAVSDDTDFVAFLDSDDEWFPNHLELAVKALDAGYEVYFSDCFDLEGVRYFTYAPDFVRKEIEDGRDIIGEGLFLFNLSLFEFFPHTSFSIVSANIATSIKFDKALKFAGEDHIYFLKVMRMARCCIVSREITGRRGFGVSIYRSTLSWDSPMIYFRIADQIAGTREIHRQFSLSAEQHKKLIVGQHHHVDDLVYLTLRNAAKHGVLGPKGLVRAVCRDPRILPMLPLSLVRALSGFTRRRHRMA